MPAQIPRTRSRKGAWRTSAVQWRRPHLAHFACSHSALPGSFFKPGLSSCSVRCPRIPPGLTAILVPGDGRISAAAGVATSSAKGFFAEKRLPVFRCEPRHCQIRVGERHFARKGDHVL